MHPSTPPPIACSLTDADRPAHQAAIERLGARAHARVDGTEVRLRDEPGVAEELERVLAVERECCPFFDLRVSREDGDLVLRIGAPSEGEGLARHLAAAFAATRRS
jgi:hypothetical protein